MKLSIKQEVSAQKCRKRCWKKYPSQWCDLNSLHCNSPSCQGRNSQVTSCPLSKAVQFAKISQLFNCHCFIQVYSATMVDEIDLSPFLAQSPPFHEIIESRNNESRPTRIQCRNCVCYINVFWIPFPPLGWRIGVLK